MTGRQDVFQQAMNQGHSAAWDQRWDKAALYYRQALEEFPEHPLALTNLGLALYELQQIPESLKVYQKAAQVSPDDPLPVEKVAQLFERTGDLEHATLAYLRASEGYLKNRDINKAIENWQRVTQLAPENLQAHTRLALVYERLGEKDKAVTEYLAMASLLQTVGDTGRAVRSVTQALQILPTSEEAVQALALLKENQPLPKPSRGRGSTAPLRMAQVKQMEAGKADSPLEGGIDPVTQTRQKALTNLASMLFEAPDEIQEEPAVRRGLHSLMRSFGASHTVDRSSILHHLSQLVDLQTRGDNRQALVELEQAVEAGLDHPAAYFDLGYLFYENNRPEEAMRQLQQAAKLPEYALGARLIMGSIHRKQENLLEAAIDFMEALKLADSFSVRPEQAEDLRQLYDPLIENQRQINDQQANAHLCDNISGLLMRPDWREQIARARDQMLAKEGGAMPIPLAEIITEAHSSQMIESISGIYDLARQGKLRSAMEEAFYAIEHAPTYLPLHTFMAELLMKQNHLQEAITKFLVVARAYSIRGEPNRAVDLYHRIIELAPMDLNARSQLLDQLMALGQTEEAINEYLELADVYYSLADLDMARKTYTEALRLAQQSRVDRSWRVKILHRMADIDLQSLDWRQALRIYEQIRTLQPDDEKARLNLIELNFRLSQETFALSELDNYISYLASANQKNKAILFVESMVGENPERLGLRSRLAELYRQTGRVQDAVNQLDAVGDALVEAGDRVGAARVVEAILALNPPNKAEYQKMLAQIRGK